jgi:filamentous hemagglutinin family protein
MGCAVGLEFADTGSTASTDSAVAANNEAFVIGTERTLPGDVIFVAFQKHGPRTQARHGRDVHESGGIGRRPGTEPTMRACRTMFFDIHWGKPVYSPHTSRSEAPVTELRKTKTSLLSASALFSVLSVASASAAGLPTHDHFVSGSGTVGKANQSLTVKQSSTTGIIDWNSFSVGKKNSVTFDNGNGATLNRVTGGNLSRIAGSLRATGSLYLMNGNGMIVSGSGRIVTGGNFAASTGSLSNSAFNGDDRRFKPGAGNIIDRGSIAAAHR